MTLGDHAQSFRLPMMSLFLAAATAAGSLWVAVMAGGSPLATVGVDELHGYGGVAINDLLRLEVWRLVSAQLIHAKIGHMALNVVTLLLVGGTLERAIGAARLLIVWLLGGGLATLISPILVEAPWNIGTGASQATFAFAGCLAVLILARALKPAWAWFTVAMTLIPGLALDFVFGGYPKPGHVAGLLLGVLFGLLFLSMPTKVTRRITQDGDQ